MKIFFSVGEPSGDLHGANLIAALKRIDGRVECVGYGGPKMAAAGMTMHEDLTQLAVMWFLRALLNLHKFWNLVVRADRYFNQHRPDAVVLIDYPGFNWWIARRAKAHKIATFYYSPPQLWAWGSWRVKKMRRFVDHVLSGLPFEAEWYRERGCNATFVGHPYFDEVSDRPLDRPFVEKLKSKSGPLVAILPGSRTQEVTHNLRWFLKAARKTMQSVPNARFAVASFKLHQADFARALIAEDAKQNGDACLPIEVHVGRTPEIIHAADCCMAVSGSVSLELLYHVRPTVILYWIPRYAYFVQNFFRKVKYITLVNLLTADELFPQDTTPFDPSQPGAEKVLFPEYLTHEDKTDKIAGHVIEWLTDSSAYQQRVEQLEQLKEKIAHGGASGRAAEYLVAQVEKRKQARSVVPQPHFLPGGTAGNHRRAAESRRGRS